MNKGHLQVPAHFDPQAPIDEQTIYALARSGEATADEVTAKVKELRGGDTDKLMISGVHEALSSLARSRPRQRDRVSR